MILPGGTFGPCKETIGWLSPARTPTVAELMDWLEGGFPALLTHETGKKQRCWANPWTVTVSDRLAN
jgi:hypothetical protein